jgi:phage baseplate assembly protein W
MAYRIPNKNPIDIGSRVAIGVSIPFNTPQVFTQTYTTQDQIKSNIINYILTDKEERIFNPNFGSSIRKFIFENISNIPVQNLQIQLRNDLELYFPNVVFNIIEIILNPDENTINITINYSIYNGALNEINIIL